LKVKSLIKKYSKYRVKSDLVITKLKLKIHKGVETLSGVKTNEIILIFLAIGLILIGILEIISAVCVYYLKRKC